ncbi:MAG TPA: NAD(P)-dependent alcohol dehydrogenase [Paracoccaceae bacterium]|nr:NAD(P)-dependent alcohol dehydrogenase [Paracoccaceae bacterium]
MSAPQQMRQARILAYGKPENLRIDTVSTPKPKADEVLVRILAAPVTAGDVRIRSGNVPRGMQTLSRLALGWSRPRNPPGWSFAGEIVELGSGATGFSVGQKVFGIAGIKGGAHADYLAIRSDGLLFPLPEDLSPAEGAAFFFGGLTAMDFLVNKARLASGERLLVNGATGAVGSAALQIAKHLGARVTAVCSETNHPLARQLGAEATQDYRNGPPSGQFDVVMDVIGTLGWSGAKPLLAPKGRLLLITADLWPMLGALLRPSRAGRKLIAGTSTEAKDQMAKLIALYRGGAYRPVVSQELPFDELAKAHAIAETFHKPGNLVVKM